MNLKNKSVLVTGGAGFIGSHLIDRLVREKPENLIVVDNFFLGKEANLAEAKVEFPSLKVYNQDASDYEKMREILKCEGVDVIFDLAVIPLPASLTKPRWVFEENVGMTLTMCELAKNGFFDTLVHFSSSEAYGTCAYSPMDEKHPLDGTTTYAASKAASDQIIFSYYKMFDIDYSIVRPFNNYGPRQNDKSYAGVIPLTVERVLNNESPIIYGDGEQTRDYLYVTDTADAAVRVYNSKNTRGKVLNIASGKEVSINTVVGTIARQLGSKKPIKYEAERPGDVKRHIANIYLAEDLIGFKPTVSFEEGMKKTIDWYTQNIKTTDRKK